MAAPPPRPLIVPAGPVGTFFARLVVRLVGSLSSAGRARLASFIGSFAFALGIRRKVTLENLRFAFPERSEEERRRIARGAYVNMALAALEGLSFTHQSPTELVDSVPADEWAPLAKALAEGKGVLVATAHFGSWELLGELLARRGVPLSAVVRPLRGALNAEIFASRERSGLKLIAQRGAIQGTLRALREGRLVAQLIDQVLPAKHGVFVPFFGRLASTTPALSIAALRTGAPVFVALAAREEGRLRLFVEGPLPCLRLEDRDAAIASHVAAMTEILERYIRRYPEQWLWLHRRWKVQPPPST